MSWEARWREMVLAGGAVAVAACGNGQVVDSGNTTGDASGDDGSYVGTSSGSTSSSGGGPLCCVNMVTDPCLLDPASCAEAGPDAPVDGPADGPVGDSPADASADSPAVDAPSDSSSDAPVYNPMCCNLVADPCCQYLHCGGPLTVECTSELACQADGGTWQLGGGATCSFPDAGGG